MALLAEDDRKAIEEHFEGTLESDVVLRLFTQSAARSLLIVPGEQAQTGERAKMTQELLEELVACSPKLSLQVYDVHGDGAAEAQRLGIEHIPAIVFGDDEDGRVRFYGAPLGNEFGTVIASIEALSKAQPMLRAEVADAARELIDEPVHLRVFVTPT
ncbi:MAG: hypothetical protein IIC31_02360 [Chloroflexi bacterium]|nr:hypothetical protein [Chloroflexota bacterium]